MSPLAALSVPVFQAPIGSAASIELVAAVSNAGGCGSLAMTWTEPARAERVIRRLRELTDAPFAANFVLSFPPKALDAVLTAGAPIVTFSWGLAPALVARARSAGACVGMQVGSVTGARKAVAAGADFLICQGLEAGGHVQSTTSLDALVSGIGKLGIGIPLIAAGGIVDGNDAERYRQRGADGFMLGTRFLATHESRAHSLYKSAILASGPEDTSMTWCFNGGWPYAGHRVLRNSTLEDWEATGCPPPGRRPGEGDLIASRNSGDRLPRYDMASPVESTSGAVDEMALYAGTGSARITRLESAREIVNQIATTLN